MKNKKRRVETLENKISRNDVDNTVILWEGINKPFKFNNKEYNTKENLESEYPTIKFNYISIVWEDGKIADIDKQTDDEVIATLKEFDILY